MRNWNLKEEEFMRHFQLDSRFNNGLGGLISNFGILVLCFVSWSSMVSLKDSDYNCFKRFHYISTNINIAFISTVYLFVIKILPTEGLKSNQPLLRFLGKYFHHNVPDKKYCGRQ